MKRCINRICLASASAALLLFCAGLHAAHAQDNAEQSVSVSFVNVGFLKAIDILANSSDSIVINYDASLRLPISHILDVKKVDIPATVTLSLQNQPIGKALQAVLDKAYTPLTYLRMGDVYTVIPDPSRKATPHPIGARAVPLAASHSITFTAKPFDEAVDDLFQTYHLPYAIQPDVPFIREGVTIAITNATVDEALTSVLAAVSNTNTSLTYRYEGERFVISMKQGGGAAPDLLHPKTSNGGWDLEFSGTSLETALSDIFHVKNVNYIYAGSLNGKQPVAIQRHFDSEEAAVVAVLRSAQPEPMRIYRKVGNLVTLLTTDQGLATNNPLPIDITCHCTKADFGAVAKVILREFRKNFRIASSLLHVPMTLSLDHASFDEAYKSICKALPPNSAHLCGDIYDFGN